MKDTWIYLDKTDTEILKKLLVLKKLELQNIIIFDKDLSTSDFLDMQECLSCIKTILKRLEE